MYLLLAFFLMPINWICESGKWKYLISKIWKISWKQSITMVLQGTSLGIITPGRIGEYGGRVIQLPTESRTFGVFSTFISSLSQNTINILGGIIALLIMDVKYAEVIISQKTASWIMLLGLVFIVIVYFGSNRIFHFFSSISFFEKRLKKKTFQRFFPLWNTQGKIVVLIQSFLRYAVYCLQYFFLLRAFGIEAGSSDLIIGIALIFAIQTLLPLTPLLQFTIRGSIALTILGAYSGKTEVILAVSYTMWLINLLFPGIIGAISLYFVKRTGNHSIV